VLALSLSLLVMEVLRVLTISTMVAAAEHLTLGVMEQAVEAEAASLRQPTLVAVVDQHPQISTAQ
jgi:hypothetical protein